MSEPTGAGGGWPTAGVPPSDPATTDAPPPWGTPPADPSGAAPAPAWGGPQAQPAATPAPAAWGTAPAQPGPAPTQDAAHWGVPPAQPAAAPWATQPGAAPGGPVPTARPGTLAGLDPRGWRTTIIAAVLMIGVVGGANLINTAVPLPADPGSDGTQQGGLEQPGPVTPGEAIDVGNGIQVEAPGGWSVTGSSNGQVTLQKGQAVIVVEGGPYGGTTSDLQATIHDSIFEKSQGTAGQPQDITFGPGIDGLAVRYTMVAPDEVDGIYVVGISSGTAVIGIIATPPGLLRQYAGDMDSVLASLVIR